MQAISVTNLKKHFGPVKAVDDISFTVAQGEVFGFLGPNGAGKTTTIRCLMDFLRPTEGEIKILGQDAHKDGVELKKKIGYLSGLVKLYDKWTGQMHIDFVKQLNGKQERSKELIERLDFDPTMKTRKLSSGNRQKLGIIMAFMCEPELLIFDEPTNALDPLLQNTVYELIKEESKKGTTIFMSSHNLAEVDKVCSRVGIIKAGKMVATEDILALKAKKMHTVKAYFHAQPETQHFINENIKILKELPDGLIMNVKGDIVPLISKLTDMNLKDIEIEHASLEDIFLEFYEK